MDEMIADTTDGKPVGQYAFWVDEAGKSQVLCFPNRLSTNPIVFAWRAINSLFYDC